MGLFQRSSRNHTYYNLHEDRGRSNLKFGKQKHFFNYLVKKRENLIEGLSGSNALLYFTNHHSSVRNGNCAAIILSHEIQTY